MFYFVPVSRFEGRSWQRRTADRPPEGERRITRANKSAFRRELEHMYPYYRLICLSFRALSDETKAEGCPTDTGDFDSGAFRFRLD